MDCKGRKRSFDEVSEVEQGLEVATCDQDHQQQQQHDGDQHTPEMTKRSRKKQRKDEMTKPQSQKDASSNGASTKPGLQFASHRLNSSVKVTDLRDLVLYCLADGVAPSWISVQNKNQFQKAVILMVPGLEKSMFDGSFSLSTEQSSSSVDTKSDTQADGTTGKADADDGGWTLVTKSPTISKRDPDNYLPFSLEDDKLLEPLKPLAKIFKEVWPIRASGDDRYSKVHSPLHSMLQRSVQESAEDKNKRKNMKGAKPVKVRDDFAAKKTPITEFVASLGELRDNSYVIHPALLHEESEKQQELEHRKKTSTHSTATWKDSIIDDPPKSNESNTTSDDDITGGRTVYAVDCEMCVVGEDEYALTRISVLSWKGSVVMDELVKPEKPITNYLTQ